MFYSLATAICPHEVTLTQQTCSLADKCYASVIQERFSFIKPSCYPFVIQESTNPLIHQSTRNLFKLPIKHLPNHLILAKANAL
jgi:hypothetical protein